MRVANRFAPFAFLLILSIVLQAIFIAVDECPTPAKAAKAFVEDFYYLDPGMQDWLCTQKREAGVVQAYLQAKADAAARQGYEISCFRRMFTSLHVNTISRKDDTALVHITGITRVAINPAYMLIGELFGIGRNYSVDMTLGLVKQNGRWRVCEGAL
jgi:hypothetical protein